MATASPLLKPRDFDLFRALNRGPLTVRQLLKLSSTFTVPFGSERRLQDRLHILTTAKLLRRHAYATTASWVQFYYTLSPPSFRLLHGVDAALPGSGALAAVGIARQHHTRCLADFVVHLFVGAHAGGLEVINFARENSLQLNVGDQHLYPDAAFTLVAPDRPPLRYFVELDNSTEPIASARARESWRRKLGFYESLQDGFHDRFRVLAIVTKSQARAEHLQAAAKAAARNPQRSLCYTIVLDNFLAQADPLEGCCFRDHFGRFVSLVPGVRPPAVAVPTATLAQPVAV